MQFVKSFSKSKVLKVITAALVLAGVVSGVNLSLAADTATFTVRVFEGSAANNILVQGAKVTLSNGQSGTTNSSGTVVFNDVPFGVYDVQITSNNHYERDYTNIVVDMDTRLDVSLIPKDNTNPPQPPGPDGCTPTPPRGKPLLNIWPISENGGDCKDLPLLRIQNVTQSTGYGKTVNANAGDTLRLRMYVHNGTLDYPENIAKNVMAKVNISGNTISAEAWADNASKVTSAQKGGNVSVTLPSGSTLSMVGSNQSSLGNMRGCFEFAKTVTFDVKVSTPPVQPPPPQPPAAEPSLVIVKTVRNVTQNTEFANTVNANPTDRVEFRIRIHSNDATANNVVLTDVLPNNFTYLSFSGEGTLTDSNPIKIGLGSIAKDTTKEIRIQTQAATAGNFPIGNSTWINTATASASNAPSKTDNASVVVNRVAPPVVQGTISIEKTVRNISDGQSTFMDSTAADPGEIVEFRSIISAFGGPVSNVIFTDTLPDRLTYVNNSLTVEGIAKGNSLTGLPIGNFVHGETETVIFRATVASANQFSTGSTSLVNTASITSNQNSASDTATVVVTKQPPTNANLSIVKLVRNVTQNQNSFTDSISAVPNELIQFQIQVTATGNAAAQNVIVTDTFPSNLNLVSGALTTNIGIMNPGETRTILLTGVAPEGNFSCGTTNLTNTAQATSTNAGTVSDQAFVAVTRTNNCGGGQSPFLSLTKEVRNITTNTGFSNSTTASNNDRVEFRLIVKNPSSVTANNVRVTDFLPNGLTYIPNTFTVDSGTSFGNLFSGGQSLGTLFAGQSRTMHFQATVNSSFNQTLVNTATATADNTPSVHAQASVFVSNVAGGNINLILSKRAFNQTQNVNATTVNAKPGDVIIYTLRVQNTGNAAATNFIIEDDLADVLQLSRLHTFGDGSFHMSQLKLSWPAVNIPAGGSVEKTFSVIVNNSIPAGSDGVMTNVYGNTINVRVGVVKGVFVAPPTGSGTTASLILAFATVIGYFGIRKTGFASLIKTLTIKNNV